MMATALKCTPSANNDQGLLKSVSEVKVKNLVLSFLVGFSLLAGVNSYAGEVTAINLDVKSEVNFSAIAIYKTTKNSFFCTEISTADGELRRVPKRKEVTLDVEKTGQNSHLVQAPLEKGDNCESALENLQLLVDVPNFDKLNRSVGIKESDTNQDSVQNIVLDNGGWYPGKNTILIGPNGMASVELSIALP